MTELIELVKRNETDKVIAYISRDPQKLTTISLDEEGRTVLHYAARSQNSILLKSVLSFTTNVNVQTSGGLTPLMESVVCGSEETASLLLSAGVDPNIPDGHLRTPLHIAAENANEHMATCLLSSGKVNVNAVDLFGRTALHWACRKGLETLVSILLRDPSLQLNIQNNAGETPLHWAALSSHYSICVMLLTAGADPLIKNNNGRCPWELTNQEKINSLIQEAALKKMTAQTSKSNEDLEQSQVSVVKQPTVKPQPVKKLKITFK